MKQILVKYMSWEVMLKFSPENMSWQACKYCSFQDFVCVFLLDYPSKYGMYVSEVLYFNICTCKMGP
jgi:hypothetical protein